MKNRLWLMASLLTLAVLPGLATAAKPAPKVLIFSGSTGFRHDSIPAADEAIKGIATKLGYAAHVSEDPAVFSKENLAQYKAIVLVSNTTNPKNPDSEYLVGDRKDALLGFLKDGKGVLGVHAAADSHYLSGWYGEMIGGYFEHHPKGTPTATLTVADGKHPATAKLPKTITRTDEWYYYKDFNPLVHVLITVDPKTIGPPGETDVNPNPNTWYHTYNGGRVFYTGLGHTADSYQEPYLVDLLTGGLRWAATGK
ncbi:MAG TPA: ThuA domain-containing protein [Steroidobacteraceae bacterium]|nr:ThuA domain-containing protein [Steroidobacteraceae bacterium]